MNKLGIVVSIILITVVLIYTLIIVSDENECTGVRLFECNKEIVGSNKYNELKPASDLFLKYCKPIIKEEKEIYIADYSECNLKVNILKEKAWIDSVEVNSENLTREEINSNF